MGAYGINIIGLSNKLHHFGFDIHDVFFDQYGTDLVSRGNFHVDVALNKHETFIEVDFTIKGAAILVCDRSLESFDFPIKKRKKVLFKFGEKDEEISDEIVMIQRDTAALELGQYIYEFIALAVPMKKLHPKFSNEESGEDVDAEGKIVYSSGAKDDTDEETPDPRWDILKKLK